MHWSSVFGVFCTIIVLASAIPISEDADDSSISSSGAAELKKKQNSTRNKKTSDNEPSHQLALQTIINRLEGNIFDVAQSVSSLAYDKNATSLPHIPLSDLQPGTMIKRQTEASSPESGGHESNDSLLAPGYSGILLQTTEKIPARDGAPAHLLIDRISVQTLKDGIPFIPPFEIKHTKVITATVKETDPGSPTAISLTKATSFTSSSGLEAQKAETVTLNAAQSARLEPSASSETINSNVRSAEDVPIKDLPDSILPEDPASTITTTITPTKTPMVDLKEAEEELKEKVAEIEAEPVILSARV